ncbi:hypothetical protein EAH_00067800 [Eimeria acervulina]|uniref:Uncharacterized protein n=1 Tax=Eimeria acervulina TaxID=5801 RepID=U6GUB2_EIMAC|nr:hypothetical protein EAH_00067800 [Eimeria acervulina]CDI82888.1 hypothetical protein EAH_00067800 [Eimeria acervulina]
MFPRRRQGEKLADEEENEAMHAPYVVPAQPPPAQDALPLKILQQSGAQQDQTVSSRTRNATKCLHGHPHPQSAESLHGQQPAKRLSVANLQKIYGEAQGEVQRAVEFVERDSGRKVPRNEVTGLHYAEEVGGR